MDITIQASSGTAASILMDGYISPYENSGKAFKAIIGPLEAKHKVIDILLNCYGGSVIEGVDIIHRMAASPATVNTTVTGVAASMGAIIALSGKKVSMYRHAKLMLHKVSGGAQGDSDKLRETADVMDGWEKSLAEIVAAKCGKTVEAVKKLYFQRGKDSWLSSAQAKEAGLIDQIIEAVPKGLLPANLMGLGAADSWAIYNHCFGAPADPRASWTIRDYEKQDPKALLRIKAEHPERYRGLFEGTYGQSAEDARRASWTIRDYEKNDPKALGAMKLNDRARYDRLFAAHYSKPVHH